MRVERTSELTSDGSDDVILGVNTTGVNIFSQLNRQVTTAVGDAVLISSADGGWVAFPERSRSAGLRLPRAALLPLAPGLENAFIRCIPGDNPALRLLVGYLGVLDDGNALATPKLRRLVVAHVHDLVALVIGAARDAAAHAEGRGVRAARLRAIKADIAENLGSPELMTVGAVAARHGVTSRQVQRPFETEGTTFSEFVMAWRLVCAHRMLSNPRYASWTITAIAFETGFGDLSYFNRAFRRLYGATPSDVREAARARMWGRRVSASARGLPRFRQPRQETQLESGMPTPMLLMLLSISNSTGVGSVFHLVQGIGCVPRQTRPTASPIAEWHQIEVFWHHCDSFRLQGHLPRPNEPAGMRVPDPARTKLPCSTR